MDKQRAFILPHHTEHGYLLLHCTKKRQKGPHFQLPGGRVDAKDMIAGGRTAGDNELVKVIKGARIAAVRELYEETGIDVRHALGRVQPLVLRPYSDTDDKQLILEKSHRFLFTLNLKDQDFPTKSGAIQPFNGVELKIKLSDEHSGWNFEHDINKVASMLIKHSKGKIAEAIHEMLENEKSMKQNSFPEYWKLIDVDILPEKQEGGFKTISSKDETIKGDANTLKAMREQLERAGLAPTVNMSAYNASQQLKKREEARKREEAAKNLQGGRGASADVQNTTNSSAAFSSSTQADDGEDFSFAKLKALANKGDNAQPAKVTPQRKAVETGGSSSFATLRAQLAAKADGGTPTSSATPGASPSSKSTKVVEGSSSFAALRANLGTKEDDGRNTAKSSAPVATPSPSSNTEAGSSSFAALRAQLAAKSDNSKMATNLNDFYSVQRNKAKKEAQKKSEAEGNLQSFKAKGALTNEDGYGHDASGSKVVVDLDAFQRSQAKKGEEEQDA